MIHLLIGCLFVACNNDFYTPHKYTDHTDVNSADPIAATARRQQSWVSSQNRNIVPPRVPTDFNVGDRVSIIVPIAARGAHLTQRMLCIVVHKLRVGYRLLSPAGILQGVFGATDLISANGVPNVLFREFLTEEGHLSEQVTLEANLPTARGQRVPMNQAFGVFLSRMDAVTRQSAEEPMCGSSCHCAVRSRCPCNRAQVECGSRCHGGRVCGQDRAVPFLQRCERTHQRPGHSMYHMERRGAAAGGPQIPAPRPPEPSPQAPGGELQPQPDAAIPTDGTESLDNIAAAAVYVHNRVSTRAPSRPRWRVGDACYALYDGR
jgi:hypothetical protein